MGLQGPISRVRISPCGKYLAVISLIDKTQGAISFYVLNHDGLQDDIISRVFPVKIRNNKTLSIIPGQITNVIFHPALPIAIVAVSERRPLIVDLASRSIQEFKTTCMSSGAMAFVDDDLIALSLFGDPVDMLGRLSEIESQFVAFPDGRQISSFPVSNTAILHMAASNLFVMADCGQGAGLVHFYNYHQQNLSGRIHSIGFGEPFCDLLTSDTGGSLVVIGRSGRSFVATIDLVTFQTNVICSRNPSLPALSFPAIPQPTGAILLERAGLAILPDFFEYSPGVAVFSTRTNEGSHIELGHKSAVNAIDVCHKTGQIVSGDLSGGLLFNNLTDLFGENANSGSYPKQSISQGMTRSNNQSPSCDQISWVNV